MERALFLDRDGVINQERGDYTWRESDFVFNPGLFPVVQGFARAGFLLFVITNQGGIAKGRYTHADVQHLNRLMHHEFLRHGLRLTAIYYCPHHPDHTQCLCRKPKPLMLEKALARYGIAPAASLMIGDSPRDMQAAQAAGVPGIRIAPNQPLTGVPEISSFLKS